MLYVGILNKSIKREVFTSHTEPDKLSHSHKYACCIGPFKTIKGANYMCDYGYNNPHIQCVDDAEKIVKQ